MINNDALASSGDVSEPCSVDGDALGAPNAHKPRAEIEAQIDAAIESRRKQQQFRETRNVPDDPGEGGRLARFGDYQYLDHTADIQLHSWGASLERALESLVVAMFGYMTDLAGIELHEERVVSVQAHDAISLVFLFLQEWLSLFHEAGFVARQVSVTALDREEWTIVARGRGDAFDSSRHTQGTEVKAVTYSNLQLLERTEKERCDIWVIVDI